MNPPKSRRLLSDVEIEIWLKIAQSVTPRPGAVLPRRKAAPVAEAVAAQAVAVAEPLKRQRSAMPGYTPPQPAKPKEAPLAPFEKRYRQKVTRGRVEIEGVMDLHGLTQGEAHDALRGFLRSAQQGGARLVLVVTGKGRARMGFAAVHPEREAGVLRRAVPQWLRAPELRNVVLGFEEAGLPHGGLGALYVRLRRLER